MIDVNVYMINIISKIMVNYIEAHYDKIILPGAHDMRRIYL